MCELELLVFAALARLCAKQSEAARASGGQIATSGGAEIGTGVKLRLLLEEFDRMTGILRDKKAARTRVLMALQGLCAAGIAHVRRFEQIASTDLVLS